MALKSIYRAGLGRCEHASFIARALYIPITQMYLCASAIVLEHLVAFNWMPLVLKSVNVHLWSRTAFAKTFCAQLMVAQAQCHYTRYIGLCIVLHPCRLTSKHAIKHALRASYLRKDFKIRKPTSSLSVFIGRRRVTGLCSNTSFTTLTVPQSLSSCIWLRCGLISTRCKDTTSMASLYLENTCIESQNLQCDSAFNIRKLQGYHWCHAWQPRFAR